MYTYKFTGVVYRNQAIDKTSVNVKLLLPICAS